MKASAPKSAINAMAASKLRSAVKVPVEISR
jgi:hypothetical protein